jgi:hypothetical protein
MKTQLMYSTFVLLFFMAACSSTKTATETTGEIIRKVEAKDVTVTVHYANPLRMKQVVLTSEYDLRIKNDSAFAYLPYFGVAYSAPYGSSEGGIKFAEPLKDYVITPNKKLTGWDIHFKIRSSEDTYEIFMNIFNNGSASFSVTSQKRDMISFSGEVKR